MVLGGIIYTAWSGTTQSSPRRGCKVAGEKDAGTQTSLEGNGMNLLSHSKLANHILCLDQVYDIFLFAMMVTMSD